MPREPQSKYFWPASAITEDDMDLLYRARESSQIRVPITQLLARAVRETFGHLACEEGGLSQSEEQLKEAA
jgi:hypothetical protein